LKVPFNITRAALRWLLPTILALAPVSRGLAVDPRDEAPSPEEVVPPVDPGEGDEVPEEMIEFLMMMELLDDYGDAIDVEVEMQDGENEKQ